MADPQAPKNAPAPKQKTSIARWALMMTVGLIVLGAGGYTAFRGYRYVKKEHLVKNAHRFLAEKRYAEAGMAAMRALQTDSNNVEATRMMVELTEATKSSSALTWRRRLVDVEPDVMEHRIALAELALKSNEPNIANEALVNAPATAVKTGAFHDLAGRVASSRKDVVATELHFGKAVELEPENGVFQLHRAAARLQSPYITTRQEARKSLEELAQKPELRRQALRALIQEAIFNKDLSRAVGLAKQMRDLPDAGFDDRLTYLNSLRRIYHPDFDSTLKSLQEESTANLSNIHTLGTWMNSNGLASQTIEWYKTLPEETRRTQPLPVSAAQAYSILGDWKGLKPIIVDRPGETEEPVAGKKPAAGQEQKPIQNWGNGEFTRLALLSRVYREEQNPKESSVRWNDAVRAAGRRPDALEAMARTALDWGWKNESLDVLWSLVDVTEDPKWALDQLQSIYHAAGSTRNLLRVATKVFERNPSSIVAQNNYISLSLLLNSNMDQVTKLATDLYKAEPGNPVYASTYAYALHLLNHTDRALEIFSALGEEKLSEPIYGVYYGLILAAAGKREEAQKYLAIARTAPPLPNPRGLLPEEEELVERSAAQVGLPANPKTPRREENLH